MIDYRDRKLQQLNTLIEMTALINSTLDPLKLRERVIEAATKLLNSDAGSLLLIDNKTGELFFEVAVGSKGQQVKSIRIGGGVGIAGWVAEHGIPLIINDVSSDSRFFSGVDSLSGYKSKSIVCVPVRTKERITGVLQAVNCQEGSFVHDDMVILFALANQVATAMENAQLFRESITDGLTGLYHHKYFKLRLKEELDRARRYSHPLSLLLIDIDFFKKVNDTFGHPAGDRVLEGLTAILRENTRLSDIIARYGGEEFAVILPYIPYDNALLVAERLRYAAENADFGGVRITISIGMAFYKGNRQGIDPRELVEISDKALYHAKNSGRNRVESNPVRHDCCIVRE